MADYGLPQYGLEFDPKQTWRSSVLMIRQDELITPTWIEDPTPVIINVTRHLQLSEDGNPELYKRESPDEEERGSRKRVPGSKHRKG